MNSGHSILCKDASFLASRFRFAAFENGEERSRDSFSPRISRGPSFEIARVATRRHVTCRTRNSARALERAINRVIQFEIVAVINRDRTPAVIRRAASRGTPGLVGVCDSRSLTVASGPACLIDLITDVGTTDFKKYRSRR